ncbi:MAG: MotA/TolQ/ExbB proton channel family protein [Lachnoclostridium sp.]|nr:MotA/TolQ/ExbB proton channel family protein [Lachnoclostridium sp.]
MRKNMYYLLFPLYAMVLVFILYINGVFTGEVTSTVNVLINVGFLLVIGILFVISAVSFNRLNQFTKALESVSEDMEREYKEKQSCLWEEYGTRKHIFKNEALDKAFYKYQKRMSGYQTRRGLAAVCDLEEYINEELMERVAMTHYNSAVSGTLTGLGILGTFLGLSMGLGSFNGNDIYTISDNVGPLLEGMKVAFHTSVYGIFFSLVFNFVYRSLMASAYDVLSEFHLAYNQYVAPTISSADENTKAMLIYQANMSNSMKQMTELLKGNAMEQTQAVERIANQFVYLMSQSLGTEFDKMGRSLNTAANLQEQCSRDYQSMEATAKELIAANRTMVQALDDMTRRQEELAIRLCQQESKLADTVNALDEELTTQLFTFNQMRDLYEK